MGFSGKFSQHFIYFLARRRSFSLQQLSLCSAEVNHYLSRDRPYVWFEKVIPQLHLTQTERRAHLLSTEHVGLGMVVVNE